MNGISPIDYAPGLRGLGDDSSADDSSTLPAVTDNSSSPATMAGMFSNVGTYFMWFGVAIAAYYAWSAYHASTAAYHKVKDTAKGYAAKAQAYAAEKAQHLATRLSANPRKRKKVCRKKAKSRKSRR